MPRGSGFPLLSRFFSRFETETTASDIDLAPLGDVNQDEVEDFALSVERTTEFTYRGVFGRRIEGEIDVDVDLLYLSDADGYHIRSQARATGIEGPIVNTKALGDINGDGIDDFATFTGAGSYYGNTLGPFGYYGARQDGGFYGDPIDEVFVTFGGALQPAQRLGDLFGIDGNVVTVKPLGDLDGNSIDNLAVSTGGFYGYYAEFNGSTVAYYGRDIEQTFLVLTGETPTAIDLGALVPQNGLPGPDVQRAAFAAAPAIAQSGPTIIDVDVLGDINDDEQIDIAVTRGDFFEFDGNGGYYGEVIEDVYVLFGNDGSFGGAESLSNLLDSEGRALNVEVIDINGDLINDLGVQVGTYYGADDPGATGYYGLELLDVFLLINSGDPDPVSLRTLAGEDRTAGEVYNLGDINGDGISDLGIGVIGYYGDEVPDVGGYYGYYANQVEDVLVVFGNPKGRIEAASLSEFAGLEEELHGAIGLGDLNGDGFDDFGVACYYGVNGFNETLIVFGGENEARGILLLTDIGLGDDAFASVTPLGDVNSDGLSDFAINGYYGIDGYYGSDFLGTSVYVVYGGQTALTIDAFAQNTRISTGDEVARAALDLEPLESLDDNVIGAPDDLNG